MTCEIVKRIMIDIQTLGFVQILADIITLFNDFNYKLKAKTDK